MGQWCAKRVTMVKRVAMVLLRVEMVNRQWFVNRVTMVNRDTMATLAVTVMLVTRQLIAFDSLGRTMMLSSRA